MGKITFEFGEGVSEKVLALLFTTVKEFLGGFWVPCWRHVEDFGVIVSYKTLDYIYLKKYRSIDIATDATRWTLTHQGRASDHSDE